MFVFERSAEMGLFNGMLLTQRLHEAMTEAPSDFDVLYLGWSGFRGGNFRHFHEKDKGDAIRKAEYVWTTVAYVISAAGARKLLAVANPIDQPVDNFMAWEASQGRLKSYVIRDEGDEEDLWAGGICDQVDFQGPMVVRRVMIGNSSLLEMHRSRWHHWIARWCRRRIAATDNVCGLRFLLHCVPSQTNSAGVLGFAFTTETCCV
jgi:hypothetical protein